MENATLTNRYFYQPDGTRNYALWDKDLCAKCNEIDWQEIFGGSWHNVKASGWSRGTTSPRSLAHIRDHQKCAFCRLTYHAMINAGTWHDINEFAVWLDHGVYAWVFDGPPPRTPDRWPSRVEKRIWLRVQRGIEGIEITDEFPVFDDRKEVMMTHAACIQLIAPDPGCTSTDSDLSRLMKSHSSDSEKNLFNDPERYNAEELKILDRVHASACRGRWMPEEQVDYDMLKHWIWTCNVFHESKCSPSKPPNSETTTYPSRVIDVRQGCVIFMPPNALYVCLSYVWGSKPQLKLTDETIDSLTSEGGLFDETIGLARTIKDAIFVCGELEQHYLWVDSICIKQDDANIRQPEIENMDSIYGGASLTIIAASGDNADSGLCGARKGSRQVTQHMETIRGRQLIASMPSPGYDANVSMWERRAWTLQERALSGRRLVFTESQVYLQCRTSYYYEDAVCEIPGRVTLTTFPETVSGWLSVTRHNFDRSDGFPPYKDIVRSFTKRMLSYDSDALNACLGILKVDQERRAAQGENPSLSFGLPLATLSYALCWMSMKDSPGRRRIDFPSWSWAGWDTVASYDLLKFNVICDNNHYMANEHDEVTREAAAFEPRGKIEIDSPTLTCWTTSAILPVDRIARNPQYPNAYAIWSPYDPNLCLGHILLAESARAPRPDELEFIVIAIEWYENGWKTNNSNDRSKWTRPERYSYRLKLLCIEWIGDIAYRVQMSYHSDVEGAHDGLTTPSEGSQSIANWKAVKPVEKLVTIG